MALSGDDVVAWLTGRALDDAPLARTLPEMCARLVAAGVPLGRAHVAFRTLHPLFKARLLTWSDRDGMRLTDVPHAPDGPGWFTSPLYRLLATGDRHLRWRIDAPGAADEFPVFEELRADGFTDYVAFTESFVGPQSARATEDGIVGSWATRRPGGFDAGALALLERIEPLFGIVAKIDTREQIARTIVEAYLGRITGHRVLSGAIRRGDGEEIHAVIWFCDLRDSTGLAARLPRLAYLGVLNQFLECMADAILAQDGEVLRFIGDAALAIFPITTAGAGTGAACARALAAARDALARLSRVNLARTANGAPPLRCGIGLHVGDVVYGNIGSPNRIEFTVIGPAANEAARHEAMSKRLGSAVVVSAAFAARAGEPLRSLGRHALPGLDGVRELFTLADPL